MKRQMLEIATLMAQELQDFVGEAQESSGDDDALIGTQNLLAEWEAAYSALMKDSER